MIRAASSRVLIGTLVLSLGIFGITPRAVLAAPPDGLILPTRPAAIPKLDSRLGELYRTAAQSGTEAALHQAEQGSLVALGESVEVYVTAAAMTEAAVVALDRRFA